MVLPKEIEDDINLYCKANNITDIDSYIIRIVKSAQTIEKYGATIETRVKEKIVEVEKIIEVEKIVERVIEVPVTIVDSELSQKLSEYVVKTEQLQNDLIVANNIVESLKRELIEEKKRNKKDLYGE